MKASDAAFYLTIAAELKGRSFSPSTYQNELGQRCVGYGHVLTVDANRIFTPLGYVQAKNLLARDFYNIERIVNRLDLKISQAQYDAIICLGYHCLWGRVGATDQTFETSRLLDLAKRGMMELAGAEFDQWILVRGKPSRSALDRRLKEKALFFS